MGSEFAIICTYEDDTRSVSYVQGTKEHALECALESYRINPCEHIVIAEVRGFVFDENDYSIH